MEKKLKNRKKKGVVSESDEESSKTSDKIDLEGLELLAATTLESFQEKTTDARPEPSAEKKSTDVSPAPTTHSTDPSSEKKSRVKYVRRKHSANKSSVDATMKDTVPDPLPEVDLGTSADIQVDSPDVPRVQPSDPPETTSHKVDKGKSILIDQGSPPRVKSKEELANEILSENVVAQCQAKEEVAAQKIKLDFNASVELAKKIQADLDMMGPPIPSTLTAERKKELDDIAKNLSADQWDNLAQQAASIPNLGDSVLNVHTNDFAKMMVERGKLLKQHEEELKAKHLKE